MTFCELKLRMRVVNRGIDAQAQRHRLEARMRRRRGRSVEIDSRGAEQRTRRIVLQPAFDCRAAGVPIRRRQFELRAAPGRLNRIPTVTHGRRIVDQQHALRHPAAPPPRPCRRSGRIRSWRCP